VAKFLQAVSFLVAKFLTGVMNVGLIWLRKECALSTQNWDNSQLDSECDEEYGELVRPS
jgi:hypothetical protein